MFIIVATWKAVPHSHYLSGFQQLILLHTIFFYLISFVVFFVSFVKKKTFPTLLSTPLLSIVLTHWTIFVCFNNHNKITKNTAIFLILFFRIIFHSWLYRINASLWSEVRWDECFQHELKMFLVEAPNEGHTKNDGKEIVGTIVTQITPIHGCSGFWIISKFGFIKLADGLMVEVSNYPNPENIEIENKM